MLISLLCAHEMNKRVRKISRLNSKRLLRKPQNMLEGYFILPHPVLFEKNVRTLTFSILWYAYILKPWSWLIMLGLYSVSQNFLPPPWGFLKFFPNGWEFLIKILHACYSFILTLNCKILFNYPELWQSYAVLSANTQWIFTFHNTVTSFTNWW